MKPSCCGPKRSLDGILGKLPGIPSTRKWMASWRVFQEKMMWFSLDGVVKLCLLSGKGWNVWCKKGGQVAKVANEQVIRQLVNACPGKITLVHHSSRGRRQDFSNIGSVELSLSDVTLLIKWLPLEKKVDGKFCGKNRRRSRNARSPKSCAIDSNWRPEVTTLHICP